MDRSIREDAALRHLAANAAGDPPGRPWARTGLALTMIGLGILGVVYGDFAVVWQRPPGEPVPGQAILAYASAAVELAAGFGLLFQGAARWASGLLAAFLLLWVVLLKIPGVFAAPQAEVSWLGLGEIVVMLAGGWVLFAQHAAPGGALSFAKGEGGVRLARLLFALSLPTIGFSHFVYSVQTVAMVPGWLPLPLAWAYLTGAGSLLACLALVFGVFPRLAATLEAAMLGVITLLVWAPGLWIKSTDRMQWTAFVISSAIACGAWVVAASYRELPWLAVGRRR
jgi:uncharacterized membrane protein YphA (DoxX/SURF4 family)